MQVQYMAQGKLSMTTGCLKQYPQNKYTASYGKALENKEELGEGQASGRDAKLDFERWAPCQLSEAGGDPIGRVQATRLLHLPF
jgi:hypothetical protein